MGRALTTRQFIAKAKSIHRNKFDYRRVYYENNKIKVAIICKVHGEFWQMPMVHLNARGCPSCGSILKTRAQFIGYANKIHGNMYDYSKVDYINNRTKVKITCFQHGEFMQTPDSHINQKSKCPKCTNAGYSKISIQFLNDLAKEWKVDIQHAENKGEYRIEDPEFKCSYRCDGYFEQNNKKYVVEFHGNYYHGNPKMYRPDSVCKLRRITFVNYTRKRRKECIVLKLLDMRSFSFGSRIINNIFLIKTMNLLKVYLSIIKYFR